MEGQQKHPVLNGRLIDCHAEPIGLYHPVFNEFQDAMANPEPLYYDAATYNEEYFRCLFPNIR